MPQSDSIAKLADALCKAQAMMKPAVKDTENPFFKSKYADLASIWDAVREPLTKNGLSVAQCPSHESLGFVALRTVLMHTSGEWMSSELVMKPVKEDPQAFGSCLTYARRYALAAIMGVCTEDDDAEAATRAATQPSAPQKPVAPQSAPGTPVAPPAQAGATAFLWRMGAHKGKPIEQMEDGYLDWASKNMKADDHRQAAIAELMRRDGMTQPELPDEVPDYVEEDPTYS